MSFGPGGSAPGRRREIGLAAAFFVFGAALAALAFRAQLTDPFRIDDDARQHLAWMARFHDPALFAGNPYVAYARFYSTPLFEALYFGLARFGEPIAVGKVVALVLAGLSAALFFLWARRLGGARFGALAALAYLAMPASLEPFSGGLQRAFAAPLLLLVLFALSAGAYEWSGFLLSVALLLYPVAAAIGLGATLVVAVIARPRLSPRRQAVMLCGLVLFAAAMTWTARQRTSGAPAFLGRFVSHAEALVDPAFQRHGRFELVPLDSWPEAIAKEPGLGPAPWRLLFVAGLVVAALVLARPDRSRAFPALGLLASSLLLFLLANALFLRLFVPIRYVQHPFSILIPLVIALVPAALVSRIRPDRLRAGAVVAVVASLAVCGVSSARRQEPLRGSGPSEDERVLLRFLATLPEGAQIAADPFLSDDVLTFARRSTFLSYELAHPWYLGYRSMFEARVHDYYRAAFSADPGAAQAFACANRVDYLVLTLRRFEASRIGGERLFFEPEEGRLRAELAGIDPRRSALLAAAPERRVFENGRYLVVTAEGCASAR